MTSHSELDWRRLADPADLREYDEFGPWIDPVRSVADMPRAFRAYYAEHAGARFLLKIPREDDRADLRPGMDLFAAVVAIHDDGVCVLRLQDGSVRQQVAGWRQIVATTYRTQLLDARLSLLLDDGTGIHLDLNSAAGGGLKAAMAYVLGCIGAASSPGWRCPSPRLPSTTPPSRARSTICGVTCRRRWCRSTPSAAIGSVVTTAAFPGWAMGCSCWTRPPNW